MKLWGLRPKAGWGKGGHVLCQGGYGNVGEVDNIDPPLGYIIWFANVVELYQKKNCNCFGCDSPDHLVKECPKELGKTTRKEGLNLKEGMAKKGCQSSQKLVATQQATSGDAPQA